MAGARPGVHLVKLKPVVIAETLIKGNKFIKWDDDSTMGTPVTLKVDSRGFILFWKDQHKDMDCLDIALIRDTRTGRNARTPKDPKLRDTVNMGSSDIPLEDKTVTICYGTDLVSLNWVNFTSNSREVAREWTDELFKTATNLLRLNASPLTFLEKAHIKLSYVLSGDGKIPVRNILRQFSAHKDDKKRVEKALESANLPSGRTDFIHPSKFTFEDFMRFYRHLVVRPEVDKIFHSLGAKKKPYLTASQFVDFLNTEQRDPRLNEILYPYYDVKRAQDIIDYFEPNSHMVSKDPEAKGHLSQEGFLRYLMSEENNLLSPEILDLNEDMDQPLSHYFINSSHNTYLTGHQLTGKSSVEIYRQALLLGCRCVELDCWDGKNQDEEPMITHGYTMCTEISFKEVIEAIADSAFKVSEYPVILSFENHCQPKQQAKMAAHCRNILGDAILGDSLETHPLEPGASLPSPALLKRKIIIKNKKRHIHKSKKKGIQASASPGRPAITAAHSTEAEVLPIEQAVVAPVVKPHVETLPHQSSVSTDSGAPMANTEEDDEVVSSSESDLDSEDEEEKNKDKEEKGTAGHEAEAGMEMSALVNYIQPVHFHSFEVAEKRNRSYECSSFVETQATNLLKEQPVEFVNFNKRQISRIYPKGTRVDSSNYMPQIFWNAGCQLVALNYQTLDLAMMLNLGIFEYNGRSGYILKPDFMRRSDRHFDPFAESTVDGIVANKVELKVISGQFLSDRKVGVYVEVDMFGLPADTVRKRFRTKTVPGNAINPVFDDPPFVFKKVVLPNLATLRIAVYEESNNRLVGHRVLPVEGLRPGYRHIGIRNELGQPQNLGTLFVHIKVKDYIPDALAEWADALANPIAYQSALEKHAQQLAVLEEDFDAPDDDDSEKDFEATELLTGKFDASDLNRKRNASLVSKRSATDSTPTLSRVGSVHAPINKTESAVSGNSQNSVGSGNVPPVTRMVSSISQAASPSENSASLANSKLNGVKSSSLPNSPMHAISSSDNGSAKLTKIDVTQTTRLKDPDLLDQLSVNVLKENKIYQKLCLKKEKDLDTLRKKHDKARNNQQELHELQEEKLLLSQIKSKTNVEKTHRKSIKRASKYGSVDEQTTLNKQELNVLLSEQESKHRELKASQSDGMLELCRNQNKAELDLHLKYHPQLFDLLDQLVAGSQDLQLKKLDEIHEKEVADLKKKLDTQNREEMKLLAKKHKDKSELARVKREAQTKHISLAVQERQKLRDILDRRKDEVREAHKVLQKQLGDERTVRETEWNSEYAAKLKRLEEEFAKRKEEVKVKPLSQTGMQHNGQSQSEVVTLCDGAEKQGEDDDEEDDDDDDSEAVAAPAPARGVGEGEDDAKQSLTPSVSPSVARGQGGEGSSQEPETAGEQVADAPPSEPKTETTNYAQVDSNQPTSEAPSESSDQNDLAKVTKM